MINEGESEARKATGTLGKPALSLGLGIIGTKLLPSKYSQVLHTGCDRTVPDPVSLMSAATVPPFWAKHCAGN